MQVGAADRGYLHLDQDFIPPDSRLGDLAYFTARSRRGLYNGKHVFDMKMTSGRDEARRCVGPVRRCNGGQPRNF